MTTDPTSTRLRRPAADRPSPPVATTPTAPPAEGRRRIGPVPLLAGLTVGLVVACIVAAGSGAYGIPPGEVVGAIARKVGLSSATAADALADEVLWEIRFPRVVLTVLIGAALGCAGATMQGAFANPLAEPGIVGVSSGAVLGGIAQIVIGFSPLGSWSLPAAAFVGGLVTVVALYAASRSNGRTEIVTLILTGVAVNALLGGVIGLLTYLSEDAELRSLTFWQLGSTSSATWPRVAAVAPFALVGIVVAVWSARGFDLLALGERSARHLGLRVERFRFRMLIVTAVLTASAVAVSGNIQFVGLVIPHFVRMLAGPAHRLLLPASALAGALVLVVADLVARTAIAPAEIPLGVITALIGSPVFFWQLRRTRSTQGGWA